MGCFIDTMIDVKKFRFAGGGFAALVASLALGVIFCLPRGASAEKKTNEAITASFACRPSGILLRIEEEGCFPPCASEAERTPQAVLKQCSATREHGACMKKVREQMPRTISVEDLSFQLRISLCAVA